MCLHYIDGYINISQKSIVKSVRYYLTNSDNIDNNAAATSHRHRHRDDKTRDLSKYSNEEKAFDISLSIPIYIYIYIYSVHMNMYCQPIPNTNTNDNDTSEILRSPFSQAILSLELPSITGRSYA